MTWKDADGGKGLELETLISGMFNRRTLLDLVRSFIVFEQSKSEDRSTGLVSLNTVKKLAACHQYHAVCKAVDSAVRAAAPGGSRKGGVVWHTQGSGKSLSMVFFAGKIVLALSAARECYDSGSPLGLQLALRLCARGSYWRVSWRYFWNVSPRKRNVHGEQD